MSTVHQEYSASWENTVNPRQSKCMSGVTSYTPPSKQSVTCSKTTVCYGLAVTTTTTRSQFPEQEPPRDPRWTKCMRWVRRCERWYVAVGGRRGGGDRRPVAAEIEGEIGREKEGSPEHFLRTQQGPIRPWFTPPLGQPGVTMATVQWEAPLSS